MAMYHFPFWSTWLPDLKTVFVFIFCPFLTMSVFSFRYRNIDFFSKWQNGQKSLLYQENWNFKHTLFSPTLKVEEKKVHLECQYCLQKKCFWLFLFFEKFGFCLRKKIFFKVAENTFCVWQMLILSPLSFLQL